MATKASTEAAANGVDRGGKAGGSEEELTSMLMDEVRECEGSRVHRARQQEAVAAMGNRLDAECAVRSCLIQGT